VDSGPRTKNGLRTTDGPITQHQEPRTKLRQAISTADGKQRYVRRLFATIADRYDFITGFLSYGQDRRWKRRLIDLAQLQSSDRVLDLACGTGDIVSAAAPKVERVVGLDVTHRMLQLAMRRSLAPEGGSHELANQAPAGIPVASAFRRKASFVTGDMLALPFPDRSFTVVTIGYGLRNVPDLQQSLREIRRVLVPDGRVLSLDFNRPSNPVVRTAYLSYLTVVGSALGYVLHRDPNTYRYIPESIRNYPGAAGVAHMMGQLGFTNVRVVRVLGGLMAIHAASAPATVPAPA
jgi:demethylmenaquinone methyltransferase/2-methoxy-6-polyprenyl-1,4-benzoquinol methylase